MTPPRPRPAVRDLPRAADADLHPGAPDPAPPVASVSAAAAAAPAAKKRSTRRATTPPPEPPPAAPAEDDEGYNSILSTRIRPTTTDALEQWLFDHRHDKPKPRKGAVVDRVLRDFLEREGILSEPSASS